MKDTPPKKGKAINLVQPFSAELKNIFYLPMKEAKNPGINNICEFCEVSKDSFIPNICLLSMGYILKWFHPQMRRIN